MSRRGHSGRRAVAGAGDGGGGVTSYNAKTLVFDFADNYGNASFMNVRELDLWFEGSKLVLTTGYSAYSTSVFSATFVPNNAFDTSLALSSFYQGTSWMANSSMVTNQRLICNTTGIRTFDELVLNNCYDVGAPITNRGVKNTKIYITEDDYTDTTYGAPVTNSTLIFDGVLPRRAEADAPQNYSVPLIGII